MAAEARHIGGGARDMRRQALGAQFVGDAQTPEMLHRARIGVVALGMLRRVQPVRDQHRGDAMPVELDRRRQADRSAADDQSKRLSFHHPFSYCMRAAGIDGRGSIAGDARSALSHGGLRRPPGEELAAVAQPFLVDAVADARGQVPLNRHAERGEAARCLEQRLCGDEFILVAVDEQDRRT